MQMEADFLLTMFLNVLMMVSIPVVLTRMASLLYEKELFSSQ